MDAARCANSTDDELMRAVALGDQSAFAEIYDRYALDIFEGVMGEVVDESRAETVVLGIFVELWRQAPRISPGPKSITAWFSTNSHPVRVGHVNE
jgi:RNA polymerase sigma-70 factor (ECF subfamily)